MSSDKLNLVEYKNKFRQNALGKINIFSKFKVYLMLNLFPWTGKIQTHIPLLLSRDKKKKERERTVNDNFLFLLQWSVWLIT